MALNLVTLAEYKAYTGKSSTTDDTAVSAIIPKASALIKSICRRTFLDYVDDAKTDVFDYTLKGVLNLEEPKLLDVSSVECSTDYGKTYTSLIEYDDFAINKNLDQVILLSSTFADYSRPNAFKVVYTAGYEEIPEDLKIATLDLVTYYLRNEASIHSNKGIGSNSVQIEYITNTKLPAHISRVLDIYVANYL